MKKFITALAVIGFVGTLWMGYTIYNYGSANMRRVDAAAYQWRLEHHGP